MRVFNSNTKKITKVVPKTNITKLDGATFANKLVSDYFLIGVQCSAKIFTFPLCLTIVTLQRCLSLNCSP